MSETLPSNPLTSAEGPCTAPADQATLAVRSKWFLVLVLLLLAALAVASPVVIRNWSERKRADFRSRTQTQQEARQWQASLDTSRAWRQWDPHDDDALMFIAQAAVELNQLDLAVDALSQVDDSYRGALQALAYRGEILQSGLNRIYDAEATWLRMLDIEPHADLPRQRLIYFYAMTLQRQKLVEQIRAAMELGCEPPEAYSYLLMKDSLNFSDGLALVTRWRAAYPDDETLEVAQAVYAAKKTAEKMIATFGSQTVAPGDQTRIDTCLAKYPSNLEVLSLKIDQATFEGDALRVLELLSQAPRHAEDDSRFWRARGWLLSNDSRDEEAEAALKRGLELNPFDWQARWLLADVLRKRGHTQEADDVSALALQGKELQQKIFERPNARDLDDQLIQEIFAFIQQTGPEFVVTAMQRRL